MKETTVIGLLACWILCGCGVNSRVIQEGFYEGRPQFIIQTQNSTWYFDRRGGGFSRLIDSRGADWIAFSKEPLNQFPASAAAGYRGLPNTVFTGPAKGAGHPGFDQCVSEQIGPNSIRTETLSGRWAWNWTFLNEAAVFTMERTDPEYLWWFLYEGQVGGSFNPSSKFWGTDKGGPNFDIPSLENQEFDQWQWVYFGDRDESHVLIIAQHRPDELVDTLWYLGSSEKGAVTAPDGMIVFGFGRGPKTQPQFKGAGQVISVILKDYTGSKIFSEGKLWPGKETHQAISEVVHKVGDRIETR